MNDNAHASAWNSHCCASKRARTLKRRWNGRASPPPGSGTNYCATNANYCPAQRVARQYWPSHWLSSKWQRYMESAKVRQSTLQRPGASCGLNRRPQASHSPILAALLDALSLHYIPVWIIAEA